MTVTTRGQTRSIPAKTDPRLPGGMHAETLIDVGGLERRLRRAVKGEVRFDPASIAMYANDASNFRQVPIGVVVPRTLDDIVATHRVCAKFGAPILNRGGGTSQPERQAAAVARAACVPAGRGRCGCRRTPARRASGAGRRPLAVNPPPRLSARAWEIVR